MTKLDKIKQWAWRAKKLGLTQPELAKKAKVKPHDVHTYIRAAGLVTSDNDKKFGKIERALEETSE